MTTAGADPRRLSNLWQLPLLIVSLTLCAYAAYLFNDARPALILNHKLADARQFLRDERPDAAMQSLSRLVATEQLPREQEAQVHLLLAESLDAAQKQRGDGAPPAHYERVIEELKIALAQGVAPNGEIYRRLGECYELLHNPVEAVSYYRQAVAIDPPRALRLTRKVIHLQIAQSQWAPAEASLDAYLAISGISDAERAWAGNQKAQLLIDRGEYVDARRLLEDALRLNAEPIAQAETRYRLGLCAWKLAKPADAQKLLLSARSTFNGRHPLDAAAALALGLIAQEANEHAKAIGLFDAALAAKTDDVTALRARLGRAMCRLQTRDDAAAVEDFRLVMPQAAQAASAPQAVKEQAIANLREAAKLLAARGNHQATIDLLTLDPAPTTDTHAQLAAAYEKRAEQIETTIAQATGGEREQRVQLVRELRSNFAASLELWLKDHPSDAGAPETLAKLARTYESLGRSDQALAAYQRLHGAYAKTQPASKTAVALAQLYITKGGTHVATAQNVLNDAMKSDDPNVRRAASIELARLLHRTSNFADALPRLEQFAKDFDGDERMAELLYLAADCSMRLAGQIEANGGAEAAATRKRHFAHAASLYDRVSDAYRTSSPTKPQDRQYHKLALLRRADCAYELGEYAAAVKLYESAATEAADDVPQALAANVQIANAYFAMGKPADARSATERAKQVLNKLPPSASEGSIPLPAAYMEQWLKWSASAATW